MAGQAVFVSVTFTLPPVGSYTVTFRESGLPIGINWSVTLDSRTQTSTGSTLVFTETNSTYGYSIGSVSGYPVSNATGSLTVAGGPLTVTVTFSPLPGAAPTSLINNADLEWGTLAAELALVAVIVSLFILRRRRNRQSK